MADEIISRAEARARGLKRYFPGSKCKYGHISERLVSNGVCIVCRADIEKRYNTAHPEKLTKKRRLQATRHRRENPERIERNRKRWEQANPDKVIARQKRWREENPEKVREASRRTYENHREKRIAKTQRWREANRHDDQYKKKAIERTARWIAENPELKRAQARKGSHTRRARQYEAGGSYTNAEINALIENKLALRRSLLSRGSARR